MDNHHGTKKGKSGVTACVLSVGTSLDVSSDISTATEASSLDCHFCGVDSPPAFKLLVTEVDTLTVPLCGARAEDVNRYLKSLRKKRKKRRKSSAKRAREKGRSRKK